MINGKIQKKKKIDRQHKDKGATNGDQHKYYSSLCRPPKSHTYISSSKNQNIQRHLSIDDELYSEGSFPQMSLSTLHRRVYLQTTSTWTNKIYLVSFVENPPLNSHKQNMTCCLIRGRNSTYYAPYSPFFLSITNITHDGNGSKQVDPLLTLYKKDKSYSSKVSSNHSLFFIMSERKN